MGEYDAGEKTLVAGVLAMFASLLFVTSSGVVCRRFPEPWKR